jgi:SPP1 family predicted phage head-tail adaptor
MDMKAGKLRHRITIQKATEAPNEYGEMVPTWGTFATVSAAVEPLRGQELWAAQAQQARVTTRIRIRYLTGITPKMRILFGAKTYLIDAIIDEEERHVSMQFMAEEWVAT